MHRKPKQRTATTNIRPAELSGASTDNAGAAGPRIWLMRFLLMVGSPLVFFSLVEGGLRLAGAGYPTSFLLPATISQEKVLVQNDRFAWRFFGRDLARQPFPLAIPQVKAPATVRVFVLGESAAYGDPQPEFGLPRMLEALLGGRFPGVRFEVVNAAMTAINSHAILPIARDCARRNSDIWVIYMGNNEAVGPFGAGTVFGPQAASLTLIRSSLAAKATRMGQSLESLVNQFIKPPATNREWGGMRMFLQNQVRQDDPRMAAVYAHFQRNLEDILDTGRRSGAKVVISTVAANLRDCAPFASLHRPGLSAQDLAEWNGLYQKGAEAQQAGRLADAVECLRQAAKIDDAYAELHYRWGRCCLALGQETEARTQLALACDQDVLRFRADSRINEIIRQIAARYASEGLRLVEARELLAGSGPRGLPGNQFLYEHVHLNFEGNYLLARAFAEEIAKLLPDGVARLARDERPWPSASECARRLAWTDWSRYEASKAMLSRLSNPPFTAQLGHAQQYEQLRREVERLRPASNPTALQQAAQFCQQALAATPQDWVLQRELALVREKIGDTAGAAECWRRVVQRLPHYAKGWQELGQDLAEQKQDDEAAAALRTALRLEPASVTALTAVAQILARQGKREEAIRQFEQALRLKPYWSPAHLGLGKVLEVAGKPEEAQRHFRQALQSRVFTPAALNALARFCFEKGWLNEAVANFNDALRLDPLDAATHLNLGLSLGLLGRLSEAQGHYAEALLLDPNLAEGHIRLGVELGRQGRDAEAAEHFAAAVRLKPDLPEARLNLGIAMLKQRHETEAADQFQEVLHQNPTNAVALRYLQRLGVKPARTASPVLGP